MIFEVRSKRYENRSEKQERKSAENGMEKIENILKNSKVMPEFDKEIFEAIIRKIIIGEKNDPLAVIFVLKSGEEYKETTQERNTKNKEEFDINNYNTVLEFYSNQNVVNFNSKGLGKTKKLLDKIRVKVVYENSNVL